MIDYSGLMRQASMTAHTYMSEAINRIDDDLGKGYAAKHPKLIGVFMQVCAQDYHTAVTAKLKSEY
tara:strand:+ start:280 stop:477 length:198 start_codon:yes stop_codon:yes gene_type:complete